MHKDLDGRVAIVTGSSKGFGSAIAKALAAEGASIVVNYVSDKAGAEKTVAAITAAGGIAIAIQGSVSNLSEVRRIFEEAIAAFGKVDILVNNAGVYPARVTQAKPSEWARLPSAKECFLGGARKKFARCSLPRLSNFFWEVPRPRRGDIVEAERRRAAGRRFGPEA